MHHKDRERFCEELHDLVTGMGQDYGMERTARLVRCWYKAMSDLEISDILDVFGHIGRHYNSLPVPAEVRSMVLRRKRAREDQAEAQRKKERERSRQRIPMPPEAKEALDKLWASMEIEDPHEA